MAGRAISQLVPPKKGGARDSEESWSQSCQNSPHPQGTGPSQSLRSTQSLAVSSQWEVWELWTSEPAWALVTSIWKSMRSILLVTTTV